MNNLIESLLKQAEREANSETPEKSSTASAKREFSTVSEAEENFQKFENKLFHIKKWNNETYVLSFELFNEKGEPQEGKAANINDFIKITLPGTGKPDWVKITDISKAADEVVVTVRPSEDPTEKQDSGEKVTSHFFTQSATNNFCLQRQDKIISCYVIGLHEETNTENTENILQSVRNYATANLGHYLGFQQAEWKTFCRNLLEIPENDS